MDLKLIMRALPIVMALCFDNDRSPAQVPYLPQKTASFTGRYTARYFPRATPESVGISSKFLQDYLAALEKSPQSNVHSVMVLKDGKVVLDASAPGYRSDFVHQSFSMSKSLVGLAYGFLCDEGLLSLDDKPIDFFPEYKKLFGNGKIKSMTVRHLLTMRVSTAFNELGALLEENWTRAYLETPPKEELDSGFYYNSMSSFLLSSLLQRVTGETLFAFLKSRLFQPLHIENVFWEENSEGVTKGGWGLYLSPEDMAKLGVFMLDGGVFEGKRLLSEAYLREMTSVQNQTPEKYGSNEYGYHVWVNAENGNILFNGMLGQDIFVIPKSRTVVVLTAGNREIFQNSEMLEITGRFFADGESGAPLPKNKRAYRLLKEAEKNFYASRRSLRLLPPIRGLRRWFAKLFQKSLEPLPLESVCLAGAAFDFSRNNTGVLPLLTAAMQNNFSQGIHRISFDIVGDRFYMSLQEGIEEYRLPVGFYEPLISEISVRGECYTLAVSGAFCENEDGTPLLKVELVYPELASSKLLKFYYEGNEVSLVTYETPGYAVCEPYLKKLSEVGGLLSFVMPVSLPVLEGKARALFQPILHGTRYMASLPAPDTVLLPAEDEGEGEESAG